MATEPIAQEVIDPLQPFTQFVSTPSFLCEEVLAAPSSLDDDDDDYDEDEEEDEEEEDDEEDDDDFDE